MKLYTAQRTTECHVYLFEGKPTMDDLLNITGWAAYPEDWVIEEAEVHKTAAAERREARQIAEAWEGHCPSRNQGQGD